MKKIKNSLRFLLVAMLLGPLSPAAAWADSFAQANQWYRSGKFQEAAKAYQEFTDAHPESGAGFFDLANCYVRMKRIGLAILAYERALLFLPRDSDVRHNLSYVNSLLEYRVQDKRNWYIRMGEVASSYVTRDEAVGSFLFVLFVLLISWLLTRLMHPDASWGWYRKGLLVLLILTGLFAFYKVSTQHMMRTAIITAKSAEVHYGPSIEDPVAFRLIEGLKVYVVNRGDTWSRIWLANLDTGWIRNDQLELIVQEKK